MQRAEGRGCVSFRWKEGATRLETLFQEGCAKIRLPTPLRGHAPEAVLINTAGGLTGGDRLVTEVNLSERTSAVITTQACERIYRSTGAHAVVSNRLGVARGSRLAWLPQETILFEGGMLKRSLEVNLDGDAELVAVEAVLFGRAAMGETLNSGALIDRWRIRRNGKLIFADDFRIAGKVAAHIARPAALGGNRAMATLIFAGAEPERLLEPARRIIGANGGASAWGGKLLARIVVDTGLSLRRRMEPLLALFQLNQPLPKVWQI